MLASEYLTQYVKQLKDAGIGTARLDCLVLLEDYTGKDRAWLLAHPEFELSKAQVTELNKQIKQRQSHIPLAFIRGKTEFYGREFIINKNVLEPRPESEAMIEFLKSLVLPKVSFVADIGTGSGALAITAKLELPNINVIATDIDPACIKVAKQNAKKHDVGIKVIKGNLLEPLKGLKISVLLCNLPYVPNSYEINQAAANEPRIAIFGGEDGLDLYRQLFDQINRGENRVQYVLTESLPFQHKALAKIAKDYGFKLQKTDDFIQLFSINM